MRLNLDLIQERRETAAIREAKYKKKVEQYYNKRVRPVSFKVGDFVYRRNEASRVENQGKLGPNWEGPYRVTEAYDNGSYKLCNMNDREVETRGQASYGQPRPKLPYPRDLVFHPPVPQPSPWQPPAIESSAQ
ncbi:hypothetical protein Tco_1260147, partial [Tanacetum coccineum]